MDLLLWRHAEAEDGVPDIKRRLTPRGQKQAQKIAGWINAHAPAPLRILVSPAKRCQETAEALGVPFDTDPRLGPGRGVADLLAAIGWPDGPDDGRPASAVLVVGHQPTLGRAAALLLSGAEADWPIKKGALWWLSRRTRHGETETVLYAVMPAELAPPP